jgi:TATA-box binding protein (TBP) (component of TFIID and TFIIIB)
MTAKVKCSKVPLELIHHIPGVRYNPGKFPCAFVKLSHGSANVFANGTIVFLGYKCESSVISAVSELKTKLGRFMRLDSPLVRPEISNVVASFSLGFTTKVDLAVLCNQLEANMKGITRSISYMPDLSNNIVVSFWDATRVILHATGRGIVTGSPDTSALEKRVHAVNQALNFA